MTASTGPTTRWWSVAGSLLVGPGCAVLAWRLALRALTAPTGRIDEVVVVGVLWTAVAVLGWYALSLGIGGVCLLARSLGRSWRHGERMLRHAGAPLVARVLGAGSGAVLTAGLVLVPAHAGAPEPALGQDLTWGAEAEPGQGSPGPEGLGPTGGDGVTGAGTSPGAPRSAAPTSPTADTSPPPPAAADPAGPGEPAAPADPADPAAPADPVDPADPAGQPARAPAGAAPSPTPAGAVSPTASAGPPTTPAGPPPPTPAGPPPTTAQAASHVVRAGESLWSISAAALPDGASAGEIAREWPRWYEANAATIGSDPDLIHPGQVLIPPSTQEGAP